MNDYPPIISEEYWANSYLSIARHYGQIEFNGRRYVIVDKTGRDIFELSVIAEREGRDKAIPPGEPADLCREDWLKIYRALGREKIIELVEKGTTLEEAKQIVKELKRKPNEKRKRNH